MNWIRPLMMNGSVCCGIIPVFSIVHHHEVLHFYNWHLIAFKEEEKYVMSVRVREKGETVGNTYKMSFDTVASPLYMY